MAKIVIVSSSFSQIEALEECLGRTGHEVVYYTSAVELEYKIATASPDLVLMDVSFSGGNGFQTCCELRKSFRFENLPIILCGECGEEDLKVWARGKGASEYLIKPLEASRLLATIESHLPPRHLARAQP